MKYDIIKLLNLEQFNVKFETVDIAKINNTLYCYITLEKYEYSCPLCGGTHLLVHSYRLKKIKHSISTNNPCFFIYKARRYKCKYCNKIFYEVNPFAQKFDKKSVFTVNIVLNSLKSHTKTFTDVAREFNLSKTAVINIFDQYVDYKRGTLPKILCFDEIYTSRKSYQKYAFVMVDFLKSEVVDVFSSRHKYRLIQSFSAIPKIERNNVSHIIIDMWDTYRDLASIYFKNASVAVDSFHVIQQLNNAVIQIRLKIMAKFDKRTKSLLANDIYYYMLKKFHYFFTKNYDNIYDGQIYIAKLQTKWTKDEIRKYLLSIDDDLKHIYYLKEKYVEFNKTATYENCDEELDNLIELFLNSHLEEFRTFGKLLSKWRLYIKNSFIRINGRRLSNGPMEGINSRIKTIMKAANGYKNFNRLRNRIIYSINKNVPIKLIKK